jgi:hypothetical protein
MLMLGSLKELHQFIVGDLPRSGFIRLVGRTGQGLLAGLLRCGRCERRLSSPDRVYVASQVKPSPSGSGARGMKMRIGVGRSKRRTAGIRGRPPRPCSNTSRGNAASGSLHLPRMTSR